MGTNSKIPLKERLRQQQETLKSGGNNYNTFIFKPGITRLRHLPAPDDQEFAVEVLYLYLSKELGGIILPSTWGDKCAFTEKYAKLSKSKDPDEQALAKKIKGKRKFMSPAIRYRDEQGKEVDTEAGVKLANLTAGQYNDMLDLYLDDDSGDFTDPDTGYDLKHKRTGTGMMDTEYTILSGKPSKLAKPYRGKTYDPVQMAKEITPSYEQTKDLLSRFLATSTEEESPAAPIKKKKKIKKDL